MIAFIRGVHFHAPQLFGQNSVSTSLIKGLGIVSPLIVISLFVSIAIAAEERAIENSVLSVVQEMASAFQRVEDYTCDVEVRYHQSWDRETGYERYRFRFYFKRTKKIRVDFSEPYPGTIVIYVKGNEKATVIPFNFLPGLKFNISLTNPILKTPNGQRIDQTDMGYFIDFVFQTLKKVQQGDSELEEDVEQITFLLRALDYINWKRMEVYRIVISKKNWLPIRIERYELDGTPVEVIQIKNYSINTHLDDRLFRPWARPKEEKTP